MKKLVLNSDLKYRTVNRYTVHKLLQKIEEKAKEEANLSDKYKLVRDKLNSLIKDYIIDDSLRRLWEKHPKIFCSTNTVLVCLHKLGISESTSYSGPDDGYNFSISTDIRIDGVPMLAPTNTYASYYKLTEEDFNKFPEKDRETLKDLLYDIILTEYECKKSIYKQEDRTKNIIDYGISYQKLYNMDQSLYEFAVSYNYNSSYLVYEDDGEDVLVKDTKKAAQETKVANMNENEVALENLKNIIDL